MKRRLIPALLALLLLLSCAPVSAAPQYCYDFALGNISELDYNGELFIGIRNQKLTTSADFQNWTLRRDLPDVERCYWLGETCVAFGPGVTLTSSDGVSFTQMENNLPAAPVISSLCAGGRILAHVYDGEAIYGTFSTTDGIHWERIEGIPDGADMFYMNGQFVVCSGGYKRGIYTSDDGVHFTRYELPGTDLYLNLCYYAGAYHIRLDPLYQLRSEDLLTWTRELCSDSNYYQMGSDSVFYENGDLLLAYTASGECLRYEDGFFVEIDSPLPYGGIYSYRLTEYGLLASREDQNFFLADFETVTASHSRYFVYSLYYQDGYFHVIEGPLPFALVPSRFSRSKDGIHWEQIDTPVEKPSGMEASNGTLSLVSDYRTDQNSPLTGTLTYPDGETARVAYEPVYGDFIEAQGDPVSGLFLLKDDCSPDCYVSPDGITRYPCAYGVLGNGRILYRDENNVISIESADTLLPLITPSIRVKLNGEFLSFMTPPVVQDGSTLIPVRFLFERAGAKVSWDAGVTTISYGGHAISFTENSATATVDGLPLEMPLPAQLINGKTLVPLRFLSEHLGFAVDYDEAQHIALVTT